MTAQQIQNRNGLDMGTKSRAPLLKYHSIPITIKRYFTDVNGIIQAKNTVPAAMQTEYPFFIFGDFDRQGGYATGLKVAPLNPGTFYLMTFIEGNGLTSQQITGFTGFNEVRSKIRVGDIVHVFTDNLIAPTVFVWIVLSSRNGSIGSIVSNSETHQRDGMYGKLYIDHFQYYTDNTDPQWSRAVNFIRLTNIGSFGNNQVQPYMFKTPYTEQDGFIRVECKFNLDQYILINTYFLFETEEINLSFSIAQS